MATKAAPDTAGLPVVAGIPITHSDRVLFLDGAITKLEVAAYYEAVSKAMLPHLVGRPLTLKQCTPDTAHCRFLRHSGERAPDQVRVVKIKELKKVGDYM